MRVSRSAGILLHISSLPGPYGIGELDDRAKAFVGLVADAGVAFWQTLPIGPTGFGDSPYASFSSFAGNELFISTDALVAEGLVGDADASALRRPEGSVDYGALIPAKFALLDRAADAFVRRASGVRRAAYERFVADNASWLEDYALFRALKRDFDGDAARRGLHGSTWTSWPEALALREPEALAEARRENADDAARWKVFQFLFDEQWRALKAHANDRGVRVIGDIPIFAAADSADVWAHRALFALDASGAPREVAGVPPDYFSEDGQLWGNPLYDWDAHERSGFAWWIERLRSAFARFDAVRIDHFRGFESYWAVPGSARTAREGVWRPAPGRALFESVRSALGEGLPVIAEDLGFITPEVRALRDDLGFPGMKILQFGFDAEESGTGLDTANPFLPHNYPRDCVVYTGTHDNDTALGWVEAASAEERVFLAEYVGAGEAALDAEVLAAALVREALKSPAELAVVPAQDLLGLGSPARMNTPSTVGGNWRWRLRPGQLSAEALRDFGALCALYGRRPRTAGARPATR